MDTVLLLIMWGLFYGAVRKKLNSGILYFVLLGFMLLPVVIAPDKNIVKSWYHSVDIENIFIFGFCLIAGFLPWLIFDKWNRRLRFEIPTAAIPIIRRICIIIIIASISSIIYITPFAIKSVLIGADEVRARLYAGEGAVYPQNIFTTIAVAIAACNIYAILFFFICCLTPSLKRYRIWLIISSLSYIFNCFAITARDGLIIVPCFYIVFFLIFRKSLGSSLRNHIKRQIKRVVVFAGVFMVMFSVSRFYKKSNDWNSLYQGTIGYMSQQKFVFDATIKGQDDFWGFEVRFPLVNRLMGIKEYKVNRRDNSFEWSFGTMYAEFYDAYAWYGLTFMSIVFVGYYFCAFKFLIWRKRQFGMIMMFAVYFYIALTGLFYTRAGGSVSMNIFYLTLSILPFMVPNLVKAKRIALIQKRSL